MHLACIAGRQISVSEGAGTTVSNMTWDINVWPADRQVRRGFELIGRIVKRRRHRLALSQRQLERLSGVDQSVISRLENGKLYGLRWARFAKIVEALDGLEFDAAPVEHPPWPGPAGVRTSERTVDERTDDHRTVDELPEAGDAGH
jgi:transcriptional regulator with XRE-family HTH domain